jgi:TonB family protein
MNFKLHAASVRCWLALATLFIFGVPCATAQQKYSDFDSLAANVANAIQKSPEAATEIPKVRTFVFVERYSEPTELAYELSARFAGLLQKNASGFVILGDDGFRKAISNPDLPVGLFSSSPAMRCYASELGATMLVEGAMQIAPDGAILDVTVWSAKARRVIFSESAIVPMTFEMRDLAAKKAPVVDPPDFSTHETRVWVNPDHPPVADEQTILHDAPSKGGTWVKCVRCLGPNFSDDALSAKMQGTIVVRAEVLADGSVARIALVRGLPCGLTDKAFEAIQQWTFAPARDPSGNPIAADTPLEITFRFY